MIELMLWVFDDRVTFLMSGVVYLIICSSLSFSVYMSCSEEMNDVVSDRYDLFMDAVNLTLNDDLWAAVKQGRIDLRSAKILGSQISNFNWRD